MKRRINWTARLREAAEMFGMFLFMLACLGVVLLLVTAFVDHNRWSIAILATALWSWLGWSFWSWLTQDDEGDAR